MTSWRSLGHRGDNTENIINATNDYYRDQGVAIITKMPVPIKVLEIKDSIITKAFFEERSTVDYHGACQGIPICFDAKETNKKSLPLQNIHEHQIEYMLEMRKHKSLAFILVNFKIYDKFVLIPIEVVNYYHQKSLKGGRKSIPFNKLDKEFIVEYKSGVIHYLDKLNTYLEYINMGKLDKYSVE